MPRIRTDQPQLDNTPQPTIIERLRSGKAVPIIGSAIAQDLLFGGYDAVVKAYGDYNKYPLTERSLAQVTQFKAIQDDTIRDALTLRENYLNFIKSRLFELAQAAHVKQEALDGVDQQFDHLSLSQMCEQLPYPAVSDEEQDPFLLLAALDLPIYLTTDFHGLLANALRRRPGCEPQIDYCRWNQKLINLPSVLRTGYEPTRQKPLVYHLHGWDGEPESMVLTEDDHYRFLMQCAQNAGKDTDPVHGRVRRELSLASLLLLGYSLRSEEFRSLFWGLIDTRSDKKASVVEIHLKPSRVEQIYLEKYLQKDHNLEVCWDDIHTYLQELYQGVSA